MTKEEKRVIRAAVMKAVYQQSATLAKHYANKHTVYSSKDWHAIWCANFEAFKAGYRARAVAALKRRKK